MPPLVLTLAVDDPTQAAWDALRERWCRPGRLVVGAHLVLFGALPGEHGETVLADLRKAAAIPPFSLRVDGVRPLSTGVALRIRAPRLDRLHERLRQRWRPWLSAEDDRPLRPHVRVLDDASPEEARHALAVLAELFEPWDAIGTGVDVWECAGGPWSFRTGIPFRPLA
ncbi:2'-5' RNA ligase family protein [Amycolatopsis sacchari]|uniref:2'-5' RNA ligase superfamily protein n=1 Tax=Amycolatopsis sacchari TaxID=115433 RepID=A0A1I3XJF6_9PSEU|nr:2'-5' RNA ligase family protein [Amycolatopsis sacchari]SFK19600.1 2'-5' RNA ligase superfamily protein [Amycolatopsis sacchari]